MKAFSFLALFLTASLFKASFGLECYNCNSATDDSNCKDNYGDHAGQVVTCDETTVAKCPEETEPAPEGGREAPEYVCFKKKVWIDRMVQVSRSCAANCALRESDTCDKAEFDEGKSRTESCFCLGDKCNSAVTVTGTVTFALTLVLSAIISL